MSIKTIDSILSKINHRFTDIINELSSKIENTECLYHYTSIKSFIEIMKSNELWFSHASFLNDPLEISFGLDVIISILEKKGKEYTQVLSIIKNQRELYRERAFDLNRNLTFMFSFSKFQDKLSSWIQYGDSGYGISLQFKRSLLFNTISSCTSKTSGDILFPVQYYSNEFIPNPCNIDGFDEALMNYFKNMEELVDSERKTDEPNVKRTLYETAKSFASLIKNNFHSNEGEWRYVIFSGISDKNLKVMPTDHSVKMFLAVPLENHNIIDLIENVMIGPSHNKDPRIAASLDFVISQEQNSPSMYGCISSEGQLCER